LFNEDNGPIPQNPGELNYIFSSFIDSYVKRKGLSYTTLNEVIGVLECCKMEVYRRVAAPYEDRKLQINGDVFEDIFKLLNSGVK